MLQSIENNAGIIGEDLALLCNYYVICALNRLLTCVNYIFWSPNSRDPLFSLKIAATVFFRLEIARNQFFPLPNSWETFVFVWNLCVHLVYERVEDGW